jgi:hypothetical protein
MTAGEAKAGAGRIGGIAGARSLIQQPCLKVPDRFHDGRLAGIL